MDANGRSLSDYPRPNLTVDAIVFAVHDGQLKVLLDDHSEHGLSLPGTFVHEGETLMEALHRGLARKMDLSPITTFRQLHVFDTPGRDHRGWVFSVAHYALVGEDTMWEIRPKQLYPVDDVIEGRLKLAFDHAAMIRMAALKLREEYQEHPDPWNILGVFTLKELREFHEAIDRGTYLRDTFRRVMEPQLVLASEEDLFPGFNQEAGDSYDSARLRSTPSKPQMGRPSRRWRILTEEERMMKRFADEGRAQLKRSRRSAPGVASLSAPASMDSFSLMSLTPKSSAADFSVEFYWSASEPVIHTGLREREAYKLFDEFVAAASSVSPSERLTNRPVRAVLRDGYGSDVRLVNLED